MRRVSYFEFARVLGELEQEYDTVEHDLLRDLKEMAIYEVQSLKLGIEAEENLATLQMHRAIVDLTEYRA